MNIESIITLRLTKKQNWNLNKIKSILGEKTSTKCINRLIDDFILRDSKMITIKEPDLWKWSDVKEIAVWHNIDWYWSDLVIEFNKWDAEWYSFINNWK